MKPFNLEEAKSGKPICDRLGRDCKFIAYVPEADIYKVAVLNYANDVNGYTEDGKFTITNSDSSADLFMKSECKEAWINVYEEGSEIETGQSTFKTKQLALDCVRRSRKYLDTVKIEFNA